MKQIFTFLLIISLFVPPFSFAQNTYVPDDNFEQVLIDLGYDTTPLNDSVPTGKINKLTYLNIRSKNISDLTGIQDFDSLQWLYCALNKLTTLNVSSNLNLEILSCDFNQLSSLDIRANKKLQKLICRDNEITQLDVSVNTELTEINCMNNNIGELNLNNNAKLKMLVCKNNQLDPLDVSANTELNVLNCERCSLTSIDLNTNTQLEKLWTGRNNITLLDLSTVPFLKELDCRSTHITSLDLSNCDSLVYLDSSYNDYLIHINLSNCAGLNEFYCPQNVFETLDLQNNINLEKLNCSTSFNLESLDLSRNTKLTQVDCSNGKLLEQINLKNGNNSILAEFNCSDSPKLSCIQVDDPAAALANANWVKDETPSYSEDCFTGTGINELSQEVSIYPNPVTNRLHLDFLSQTPSGLYKIEIYDATGLLTLKKDLYSNNSKLNLENFQPGVYFVNIGEDTRRIVLN